MARVIDQHGKEWPSQEAYFTAQYRRIADLPKSPEEARAQGYEGYSQHLPSVICPALENPRVFCATCQGPMARLALTLL